MKTHQILCRHTGEYSYTSKDPVAVWEGQVDLEEHHDCILSSDDWRPVTVTKYEVREVTLPDWLSPEEWLRDAVPWKYNWGMGVNEEWPESWQRALLMIGAPQRLACVNLLKVKKFRSDFRASLRVQLESWIEGNREYDSPFSRRQWDALISVQVKREADNISSALYRSR
jgi:hypothetical protein